MLDATVIPHPLTRAEYDRLVERGVFEDERIELLRGELVQMSPQGPLHAHVATCLGHILFKALGERAWVRLHSPLAVSDDSEPEPDLAVVPRTGYRGEHPTSAYLVIEVADSSLPRDRGIKAKLYAECGIPEYWIIHAMERVIEVYTSPERGAYRVVTMKRHDDTIALITFPDVQISLDSIF